MNGVLKKQVLKRIVLFAMVFLMILLQAAIPVSADDGIYVVELIPSADHVLPGETFQLYVVIARDSGSSAGSSEVAAFQANLFYDRDKVAYQEFYVNNGTIGQYDDSTGLLTGFGEGQAFDDTLDYAVLTMQMLDTAEGKTDFSLSDIVLGTQSGTELIGVPAPEVTVTIGNGGSSTSYYNGNGSGNLTTAGSSTISGAAESSASSGSGGGAAVGSNGGASADNSVQTDGPGSTADADLNGTEGSEAASGPDGSAPAGDDSVSADGSITGTESSPSDDTSGRSLIIGIVALVIAAAAGGGSYYLKKKGGDQKADH